MGNVEKLFDSLPKTRAEAVRDGSNYYFTGKPCVYGHVDRRKVNGGCYTCWIRTYSGRDKATGERIVYDESGKPVVVGKGMSYPELKRAYDELKIECAERVSRIEELTRKVRDLNHDLERYRDG